MPTARYLSENAPHWMLSVIPVARSFIRRTACRFASLAFLASATAAPPAIRWITDPAPGAVEVTGISGDALPAIARHRTSEGGNASGLAVFAEPVAGVVTRETTMPPIAGRWRLESDRLRFEPQFPWTQGVRYRAEYRPPGGAVVVSFFELPEVKPATPTEVVQVFPSAALLPENQLKFYVQFSAPMSRGGVYEHVHIRDAQGRVIDLPFLELDEELWDPAMTRLTLLIDPGRIKRGVKPLEDIGPVFEAGNSYSLTLDSKCRDAAGHPLRSAY